MTKLKLLFVDDDGNVLKSFQRNLRSMQDRWDIRFASGGKEALTMLSGEVYDIIIADYKMPEMNGLELLVKVKEGFPGIKRVLLSGQSEEGVFEKARDIVDKYIAKPCNTETLISILQSL